MVLVAQLARHLLLDQLVPLVLMGQVDLMVQLVQGLQVVQLLQDHRLGLLLPEINSYHRYLN